MNTPLENSKFGDVCYKGPPEIKEFLEIALDSFHGYRGRCKTLLSDLSHYDRIYDGLVGDILKVKNLLDTMVWGFLAIIKKYCEDNKIKEKKVVQSLESDLDNYMNHINTTFELVFSGPQSTFSFRRVAYLSQNLATIFNSLIGPCLLDAYKNSLTKKPDIRTHLFSKRTYQVGFIDFCEPKTFYEELYKSISLHTGIFKKQLWIMTKGKVQKLTIEQKEKSTSKEEKADEGLKGLEGLGESEEPEKEIEFEGQELEEDEEL